jgi:hypothetical protein
MGGGESKSSGGEGFGGSDRPGFLFLLDIRPCIEDEKGGVEEQGLASVKSNGENDQGLAVLISD